MIEDRVLSSIFINYYTICYFIKFMDTIIIQRIFSKNMHDWSIAVRDCGINSVINFTLLKVTIYKPHYARNRFS